MKSRARALAILVVVLTALPAIGGSRESGVGRGTPSTSVFRLPPSTFQCCGLPNYVRTAKDGWPKDALPRSQQTLTIAGQEYHYFDWEQSVYDLNVPGAMMITSVSSRKRCLRSTAPGGRPTPGGCSSAARTSCRAGSTTCS